jgi:hypothetical protein
MGFVIRINRVSLVRIGPLSSLYKIVPFQRTSMTDSIESIGQGEISFFGKPAYGFHCRA